MQQRSEQACPVCGKHTVAVDEPPRIDVLGVQAYSDIVGMGDLPNEGAIGIVCLSCNTHWASKDAFDRGEPDPPVEESESAEKANEGDTSEA
jgi:hypothetical protein